MQLLSTKVYVAPTGKDKFKGMKLPWRAGGKLRFGKRHQAPLAKTVIMDVSRLGYCCCHWKTVQTIPTCLPASVSLDYPEKAAASGSLLPRVLLCLVKLAKIHGTAPGITIILYIKV